MRYALKNIFVKLDYYADNYPQWKENKSVFKERIIRKKFRRKDGQKLLPKALTDHEEFYECEPAVVTFCHFCLLFLTFGVTLFGNFFPSINVMAYIIAHDSDFRNPLFEKK